MLQKPLLSEVDRRLYSWEPGSSALKLLLIAEDDHGTLRWTPLGKSWPYALWLTLGERGGLVETQALTAFGASGQPLTTIEDYVACYRTLFTAQERPIATLWDTFTVTLTATYLRTADIAERQRWEQRYGLTTSAEHTDLLVYQRSVTDPTDLAALPLTDTTPEATLTVLITPRSSLAVAPHPIRPTVLSVHDNLHFAFD
ncbi:MAG: hypothetical protein C7B44_06925 [Sulfobacillus thermosulfidooxidans]|nr:MAG: hypothetical protein C7B44_06925 [Sulfobacillus thermosulfidooxidans]